MALFIGLMSGTSLDGVDGVLARFDDASQQLQAVPAHAHAAMPPDLAESLLALNASGADEIHRAAEATRRLMQLYAGVVDELVARSGVDRRDVAAVGAHGQTVRHRPRAFGRCGYTVQLADGADLAERTGITTVCDFRSADIAAGGQGAPLVPAFHARCWAEPGVDQAVLNVGGIANLTLLHGHGEARGFDTGPGNLLMDLWCRQELGLAYDADGHRARRGRVDQRLLQRLLDDPFFSAAPPKSTGRDDFNAGWLGRRTAGHGEIADDDMLATLCELTACSAATALRQQMPAAQNLRVCGGGAYNRHLLDRLASRLPGTVVETTQSVGIPPDQVEALAFAWLAASRLAGKPGNLPAVTGAVGPRVLGAVYAAPGPGSCA